jgi:hypothetical protein
VITVECDREQEIVDAILGGRWPDACEPSLRAHARVCAICRDVLTVALTFHAPPLDFCESLPSPGLVWWRATARARAEAARTAGRPIGVVQALAGACAAGLACGLAGAAWRTVQRLEWPTLSASPALVERSLPLVFVLGLGVCVVAVPIALYFARADE